MSPADLGGVSSVMISGTGLSETGVVTEKAGAQSRAPMALPRLGWGTGLGDEAGGRGWGTGLGDGAGSVVSLATVPSPVRLENHLPRGGRASGVCGARHIAAPAGAQ